jgi:hypothetical protein
MGWGEEGRDLYIADLPVLTPIREANTMARSSPIESYRDLKVWQRGIDLVEQTYDVTDKFPPEEKYGLTAQLRRAVVSISSNIAEGWGYSSRKQYVSWSRLEVHCWKPRPS